MIRTHAQLVRTSAGPQVVCARLRGVRAGGRYRVRMLSKGPHGSFSEHRGLRTVARSLRFAQDGCAR